MILLCLDTTMARCSVAAYDISTGVILSEAAIDMERGYAEVLPPMVAQVLTDAGIAMSQVARVAVTTGPGTFTGQRIGLSFAKGLAVALNVPLVGIDSFSAIAKGCGETSLPIAVVIDARLGQFYFSLFNKNGNIEISPCLEGLTRVLALLPEGELLILGSGADVIRKASSRSNIILRPDMDLPKAARFASYAAALTFGDGAKILPLYLKSADAKPQVQSLRPAMNATLRKAENHDLATMASIHSAGFEAGWSAVDLQALLETPRSMAIVAVVDAEVVGFALARMAADEAEILTICIDPSWQRRKIGDKLLATLIKDLRAHGITTLFLEVAADNTSAIGLYHSHGFLNVGVRKSYYARRDGSKVDAVVLRLAVANG
jgi:tRNA threonylcarbamoyl adenosine modification protein YeaZ/ribosomal-protein-alanine acetyltransferase